MTAAANKHLEAAELRALRAPEHQYLFELGRQYRIADPDVASLGRRMREARSQ